MEKTSMRMKHYVMIGLALSIFLYMGVSAVISRFPEYDDAYNASVAKNLGMGYGYASSFNTKILFPPEVSSGPSLIFPGALFIFLFGNQYWVPALTTFVISFGLFIFIVYLLYDYLSRESIVSPGAIGSMAFFALNILLLSIFWQPEIRSIEFIAEVPAALFFCAGVLVLFKPGLRNSDLFLGGLLLGLSVTAKMITLGMVLPVLLLWVISRLIRRANPNRLKPVFTKAVVVITGTILPGVLFELYKLTQTSWDYYVRLKQNEFDFFSRYGSGITQTANAVDLLGYIRTNAVINAKEIINTPHALIILILFAVVYLLALVFVARKINRKDSISELEWLSMGFLFSVVSIFLWWLGFNHIGWYRTISPAVMAASLGLIISMNTLIRKPISAALMVLLLLGMLFGPAQMIRHFTLPEAPVGLINATDNAVGYLEGLQEEGVELLGCRWWANRRLEYFMPGNQNFNECFMSSMEDAVLVIDRPFWNWGDTGEIKAIEAMCTEPVFEEFPYVIFRCNP